MKTVIKIALLQLVANKNDQEANLKKGDLYCRKAIENFQKALVFSEGGSVYD
jgi:predicted amidohydrolase